jgi:hypothetical protein
MLVEWRQPSFFAVPIHLEVKVPESLMAIALIDAF